MGTLQIPNFKSSKLIKIEQNCFDELIPNISESAHQDLLESVLKFNLGFLHL